MFFEENQETKSTLAVTRIIHGWLVAGFQTIFGLREILAKPFARRTPAEPDWPMTQICYRGRAMLIFR
jgi:hypothetical protein